MSDLSFMSFMLQGDRVEKLLEEAMGSAWATLAPQTRYDARAAAVDLVALGFRQFRGGDAARELAFTRATIAGIVAVVAENERGKLVEGIISTARVLGEVLGALAAGVAKGAMP